MGYRRIGSGRSQPHAAQRSLDVRSVGAKPPIPELHLKLTRRMSRRPSLPTRAHPIDHFVGHGMDVGPATRAMNHAKPLLRQLGCPHDRGHFP